ncbi:MAG: bifunctional glutamate N-acetyltransferase/amino-acid acetyltransferase ArgJ [Erysipelotrichaceae bacterium]|nr:bifunctional glutamate N-acetyltransferase/amino-acid acetyltransferase ArgJ [Erysipelotrichaceae bacterium]
MRKGVCAPKGFKAGSICAYVKDNASKDDLALIFSEVPCSAAAVYTTNVVKADPLKVNMEHLKNHKAQAILANSGNANAAAPNGWHHAKAMAEAAADFLDLSTEDVLVASTGVIGVELPSDKICRAVSQIELTDSGSEAASIAIMTTDTRQKSLELSFMLDGKECTIGGIAKGSGMIHPNMGTMLCFITTDAAVSGEMLEKALKENVKTTFNRVSVDGDTSTNDMVVVLANGLAGNPEITQDNDSFRVFKSALRKLMQGLAIEIARDGEGASRLLTVTVTGACCEQKAETLAKSVVCSSLLKAAMFGQDANWGRVICAMGYSGADFDPDQVDIAFASQKGEVEVCRRGRGLVFDEDLAAEILSCDAVDILISLQEGNGSATCWGCDLTYDYVKINGDYRT